MRTKVNILCFVCVCCFSWLQISLASETNMLGKPDLKLTGQIENCEIVEEGTLTKLLLTLKLDFTNTGDVPILLIAENPGLIEREVKGRLPDEKNISRLYFAGSRPSIERGEKWTSLRKALDQRTPPNDQIETISPGAIKSVRSTDWFYIDKKPGDSNRNVSWSNFRAADRLLMQLSYEMWPLNIELRESSLDKKMLGRKLQRQWKAYGYLWLDEIRSQPIELNLQACKN